MITLEYSLIALQIIVALFLLLHIINSVIAFVVRDRKEKVIVDKEFDFGVIITAYKEAEFVPPLIESLLLQSYRNFQVYVVADQCDMSESYKNNSKVTILQPDEPLNSKVQSIKFAVDQFKRVHDSLVVFDHDNLLHPNFLCEINKFFQYGYKAVQGRRTAKNLNTHYACLDATHEYFYNHTQRLAPYLAGSSAILAGSGMAFETQLYLETMNRDKINASEDKVIVGMDKILQHEIVKRGHKIAFANDAIVYDEKSDTPSQVERQRSRWHNSYFKHLRLGFSLFVKGILHFNLNQFLFGVNIINPPLFLTLILSLILMAGQLIFNIYFFYFGAALIFLFTLSVLSILYTSKVKKEVWLALFTIPQFILLQVRALLKLGEANSDFLATSHSNLLTINDVINKEN